MIPETLEVDLNREGPVLSKSLFLDFPRAVLLLGFDVSWNVEKVFIWPIKDVVGELVTSAELLDGIIFCPFGLLLCTDGRSLWSTGLLSRLNWGIGWFEAVAFKGNKVILVGAT